MEGITIDGRYRLLRKLGSGAFGAVYEAEWEIFGIPLRKIALKLIPEKEAFNGMVQKRENFNDAISLIRLLENCNDLKIKSYFTQIYDIGLTELEDESGELQNYNYIVMELMSTDLRRKIGSTVWRASAESENFRNVRPKATIKETLFYLKPVIEALAFMHAQNPKVLHRDLKPANVLIHKNKIVVGDFGLALQMFELLGKPNAAGTVHYQDLESYSLQTADCRSDVFAIGVMLYEFLTGMYPFKLPSINPDNRIHHRIFTDQLKVYRNEPLLLPSKLNLELKEQTWLEEIIVGCLTAYRATRIQDAVNLLRLIEGPKVTVVTDPRVTYRFHLREGENASDKGQSHWEEALRHYDCAIKIFPKYCDATVGKTHLLIEMDALEEAEKLLLERQEKGRTCSHFFKVMALLYKRQNNKIMERFYLKKEKESKSCTLSF